MAVRTTMAELIERLRLLVFDPAGASQTFTDAELQTFLDRYQTEVRYAQLDPYDTIQSGGSVVTLTYRSALGPWEGGVSLLDSNFDALSPATADLFAGRWTFASDQDPPVYIVGHTYDLYAAAVDVLTAWLARLKAAYDFTADGATFHRSQQAASLCGLIVQYSAVMAPQVMTVSRGDIL